MTTWTARQQFQQFPGGPIFNILGQTGARYPLLVSLWGYALGMPAAFWFFQWLGALI